MNEIVKRQFAEQSGVSVHELQSWQRLVAGACAGLSYWVLNYPLDLVKSTMMAADYKSRGNWISTAQNIYSLYGYVKQNHSVVKSF